MRDGRFKTVRFAARPVVGIFFLGAFGVGVAYAFGYFDSDRKADPVKRELTSNPPNQAATRETADNRQRLSRVEDTGDKIRLLPEELRRPFGGQMQKMVLQHITSVMAMPPSEQAAAMDKDIELMQAMSKEFAKRRAEREAAQKDDKTAAAGSVDSSHPNAGRNRILSSVPADQRANWSNNRQLFQAYQAMLQNRATQRGISLPTFGPR
jgi:hypothetical protein